MALCKTTVYKVYGHIIEDVISNVRDIFTDEGIDEQILQELKSLWESKLLATKAVDANAEQTIEPPTNNKAGKKPEMMPMKREAFNQMVKRDQAQQQFVKTEHAALSQPNQPVMANQTQMLPTTTTTTAVANTALPPLQNPEDKLIPIQITLPTQPTVDAVTRVLTIHVPASALNGSQLHTLLTGPVITATMGLPTPLASSLLQQHVNAALQSQQKQAANVVPKIVMPQMDGAADDWNTSSDSLFVRIPQVDGSTDFACTASGSRSFVMPGKDTSTPSDSRLVTGTSAQSASKLKHRHRPVHIQFLTDGGADTSDDDEDVSDDDVSDDDMDEEKEDVDPELEDGVAEEEPLNSEDDVTDEEPTDLFDTDNVVVCQYDKITRCRNKWKFYLKDGIMNLEGEDFVFQKANGDAEW